MPGLAEGPPAGFVLLPLVRKEASFEVIGSWLDGVSWLSVLFNLQDPDRLTCVDQYEHTCTRPQKPC